MSSPVNGSVPAVLVVLTEEQTCDSYCWQVELCASAKLGTANNTNQTPTNVEKRLMNPFFSRNPAPTYESYPKL
jgi:hypothetical protein